MSRSVPAKRGADAPSANFDLPGNSSADPSSPDSLASAPSIPDLTLIRCIGSGGYGEVWLASTALGTLRAVKIVRRAEFDDERPYEREFAGIRKFEPISRSHEGFVDLLHVARNDAEGYFYYVMELADGVAEKEKGGKGEKGQISSAPFPPFSPAQYSPRTLSAEVKARGALPLDECLRIARTLTSALAELHRHGLVHRDIKPSNIIFVEGVPKLADIGLVAAANEARSFVGTEGFIPPEGPGTPQADLYSLGIVLYVMSTGKSHRDFPEPPADLATRPDRERWLELQAIIHRACQADPRQRYASAGQMRADIDRMSEGKSVKRRHAAQLRWKVVSRISAALGVIALAIVGSTLMRRELRGYRPLSSDPEALVLYQQGKGLFNRQNRDSHLLAYTNFVKALELDSNFLDAYYMIFETYFGPWADQMPPFTNRMENCKWVIEKMRALDAKSAQYHTAAAWLKALDWKWDEEIEHLELALRANPNFLRAHGFYGGVLLRARGDPEGSLREFKAAELIDANDSIIQTHLGTPYYVMGDYTNAITQYQKARELEPRAGGHLWLMSLAYEANGQYEEALDANEKNEKLNKDADAAEIETRFRQWRSALAADGPRGMWRAMLAHYERSSRDPYWMAAAHARLGNTNEALSLLETALNERHGNMPDLLVDHFWRSLYDQPRFQDIVKQMGFKPKR